MDILRLSARARTKLCDVSALLNSYPGECAFLTKHIQFNAPTLLVV